MAASGSDATRSAVSDAIASGSCVHGSFGSTLVMASIWWTSTIMRHAEHSQQIVNAGCNGDLQAWQNDLQPAHCSGITSQRNYLLKC